LLRPIKPEKVVRLLEKLGFVVERQKGSHMVLKKGSAMVVIPMHKGKDLKKGTLRRIISHLGLSVKEFMNLLRKL
jgi:predicted RNA binding protein YcfA (HicA-like mRNA interferase family)